MCNIYKYPADWKENWRDFEDVSRKTGSFSGYGIIQYAQNLPVREGIEVSSFYFNLMSAPAESRHEIEIEDVDFSTLLVRVTHRSETCWPVSSAMPGHQDSIANDRGVL